MAMKVVSHALFEFSDADGVRQVAMRGARIDVDGDDLARGEQFGAFFADEDVSDVSSPLDGALVGNDEVLDGIVDEVDLVEVVAGLDEEQRAALAAALGATAVSSPAGAQPTPLDVAAAGSAGDELSSTGVVTGSGSDAERPPKTANKGVWLEFRGLGDLTEEQANAVTKDQLQDDAFMSSYQRPAEA